MASRGYELLSNASATGDWVTISGGRMTLAMQGTLATTTKLQMLGKNGSAMDIDATVSLGMTTYDLPDGQYRISLASGSPAAIYADLANVKYY